MRIYTKKGDDGTTERPGGRRVRKEDAFVHAVGSLDELNACLGLCLQRARVEVVDDIVEALQPIQSELLAAGALLAAAGSDKAPAVSLDAASVTRMEGQIDRLEAELTPLTAFILPGGTELACRLHFARTICRRAERAVVAAVSEAPEGGPPPSPTSAKPQAAEAPAPAAVPAVLLNYLNRLGDMLFVLARTANYAAGVEDELWQH
jgi:cob(I)alamin adenosyltransferase